MKSIMPRFRFLRSSLAEMIMTLAIIHIPIALRILYMKLDEKNSSIPLWDMFSIGYRYGDVLGYSAGLLASSTVWFFINIELFKARPLRIVLLTLSPIVLLFLAAPLYLKEVDGSTSGDFTVLYVQSILLMSFLLWFISLYQQRAIVEMKDFSGNEKSNIIVRDVRKPQ